jgi:hypothetical protein
MKRVEYVEIPIDSKGTTMTVNVWDLKSHYFSTLHGKTYYFHPELVMCDVTVDEGEVTERKCDVVYLCEACYLSDHTPVLSLASGVDFGNYERIPGLQPLNVHEQAILARVRRYSKFVKVRPNDGAHTDYTHSRLQAHVLLFEHDAVFVAADEMFTINNIVELLGIHFVGPEGELDRMAQETWNTTTLLA